MSFIRDVIQIYIDRREWFLDLILQHIQLSFTVIIIAGIIGLSLGIWISDHEWGAPIVLGIANAAYTIPSIALFGMLIPVIGIGNKTAIVAMTIYGIMPMVRNTYAGIKNVDTDIILAARGMGSTERQIMWRIKLPLALGVILAGFRSLVVMTISVAAIASFIGAGGLGIAIYRGISIYNPALTFSGSILVALMALCMDLLIGNIEKRIKKRRRVL